jgi:DNA polymerase II
MIFFLDAYRSNNKIVLWLKTNSGNTRFEQPFQTSIFLEPFAENFLQKFKIAYSVTKRQNYLRQWKTVLSVPVGDIMHYESFVRNLEKLTKYRVTMYNADIPPEQEFVYQHNLFPGCGVKITDKLSVTNHDQISLKSSTIKVIVKHKTITQIIIDAVSLVGSEKEILKNFLDIFNSIDPDVIKMDYAYSKLPIVAAKLQEYGLPTPFHRWDHVPIKLRGGKSFFSYGQVQYKHFAIRLHGRFLVDTTSTVGSECDVDGILELCSLTGAGFQQVASRSFGASFQHSLVRLMYRQNFLIPYKEKPVDIPLSLHDLLQGDRGGQYLDPLVGFHKDVAEIDFSSMFPWIIYNKNVSADTILFNQPPFSYVPGLPIRISHYYKGLVPQAVKPLLDRRMYYKKHPSTINNNRSSALKWVLVTAYGYLRFREFKLGIASSHMAICAYAREILLQSMKLAEQRGFQVVHGIIDSLYIKKKNIQRQDVLNLCKEIEQLVGIPVSFEGIFNWITFLPSVNDANRPLPATYYGSLNGHVKARGIEVRQRKVPPIVKYFQQQVLDLMAECSTKQEILTLLPGFCRLLRDITYNLPNTPADLLTHKVRISKTDYKHNLPQKKIVNKLKRNGVAVFPGMFIYYIMQQSPVLLEDYSGRPNVIYYRNLLIRSLFVLLQPFRVSKLTISELAGYERQLKISDFSADKNIHYTYLPYWRKYKRNRGLSERQIKRRLENSGWEVWRGGLINLPRKADLFPNVRNKYLKLIILLNSYDLEKREILQYFCHQSGMPDFICHRQGQFKFVECKFNHEELSLVQRRCIVRLQKLDFKVEIIKLVDPAVRMRKKVVNYHTNQTRVLARQQALTY